MDLPAPPAHLADACARVVNLAGGGHAEVYIGRKFAGQPASRWGNPHRMVGNSARARAAVLVHYWDDLIARPDLDTQLAALRGRTLGCWCAPAACHGHLLAAASDGHHDAAGAWVEQLRAFVASAPYRLLVTGSRDWDDEAAVAAALNAQHRAWGRPADAILVHGAARGADTLAAACWQRAGLPLEPYPADWSLGRRAGPVRNAAMIATGVDACVAFPLGASKGTRGCIALAQKAGIPVTVIEGGVGADTLF